MWCWPDHRLSQELMRCCDCRAVICGISVRKGDKENDSSNICLDWSDLTVQYSFFFFQPGLFSTSRRQSVHPSVHPSVCPSAHLFNVTPSLFPSLGFKGSPSLSWTQPGFRSDHPVAFVRWGVCDDITTLGGVSFPVSSNTCRGSACRVQMQCHLLWDESVQVDVLKPVTPAAAHGTHARRTTSTSTTSIAATTAHMRGRTWSTRAHTDAGHGST